MKKILPFIILVVFLVSCSNTHNGILIGVKHTSITQIPVTTAVSAKVVKEENVKYFSTYKSVAHALEKGKIDLSILPTETLFLQNYKNIKILNGLIKGGYGILGNQNINSLQELKGKTVGVLKKTLGEYLLTEIKDSLEIKIKLYSSYKKMDLDFIYNKISGEVLCLPKLISKVTLKNKVIFWFSDKFSFYPYANIVVNKQSYKKNKKQIDKIVSQLVQIGDELMESPKLFFETNEKIFGITLYKAKLMSYRIRFIKTDFKKNHDFEKNLFNFMNKRGYTKLHSFENLVK